MIQGLVEGVFAVSAVASLLTIVVISWSLIKARTPERVAVAAESRRSRQRRSRE